MLFANRYTSHIGIIT